MKLCYMVILGIYMNVLLIQLYYIEPYRKTFDLIFSPGGIRQQSQMWNNGPYGSELHYPSASVIHPAAADCYPRDNHDLCDV